MHEIQRLTPAPLHLLVAMSRGARLRRNDITAWFCLIRPPRPGDEFESYERVHARAPNTLIRLAFVERFDEFDWRVSAAGHAWLASNGIAAKSDKHVQPLVTLGGK